MRQRHHTAQILFSLAILLCSAAAHAQCSKDSDCKGDRVCVDGKCTDPSPAAATPASRPAPKGAIEALAKDLADRLGMPADRQEKVFARFNEALAKENANPAHATDKLKCVVAYQMGEGGAMLKKIKGKGLVQCLGSKDPRSFTIRSYIFGAVIGGSSEWGVGLVFGLQKIEAFGGVYKGSTTGATMGGAGVSVMELKATDVADRAKYHELYLIGAPKGFTANAGGARITLELD